MASQKLYHGSSFLSTSSSVYHFTARLRLWHKRYVFEVGEIKMKEAWVYRPCRVCRKSNKKRLVRIYESHTSNGFLILVPKSYCEGVGGTTSLSCWLLGRRPCGRNYFIPMTPNKNKTCAPACGCMTVWNIIVGSLFIEYRIAGNFCGDFNLANWWIFC